MSDEFSTPDRTFADGHDPTWTAMDKSDDDMSSGGGGSLHYYSSPMVTTSSGFLNVSTDTGKTEWIGYDPYKDEYVQMKKQFRSGMVNSWNKFCFTGGIVEIDAIMPGSPGTGGLWPAMWILGNLGRATYEGSTNKIWPWSYDECDRGKQHAQEISACNKDGHYGMKTEKGRGSTEIDIIEIMPGTNEALPSTDVRRPYAAMTLQVAPGVTTNRPNSGQAPVTKPTSGLDGHAPMPAQSWYDGLEYGSNTTINPFFYGTYLGETKPEEPTLRTKAEAYQADAVGAMHGLKEVHFEKVHTYRMEWRPGRGGRIDWYVRETQPDAKERPGGYPFDRKQPDVPASYSGSDEDGWLRAFTIKDESLHAASGAQIPIEPSYLIFNTAVSSTWGFPYNVPDTCKKCYDCSDPACSCALPPGFCDTLKPGKTSLLIDSVRVYQDPSDASQTVGCDPVGFPTREFIEGHEYRYLRPLPFTDQHPLKPVKNGGGHCVKDKDCGEGVCGVVKSGLFGSVGKGCLCDEGWTGPLCKSRKGFDDEPGAYELELDTSWFLRRVRGVWVPRGLGVMLGSVLVGFVGAFLVVVRKKRVSGGVYKGIGMGEVTPVMGRGSMGVR